MFRGWWIKTEKGSEPDWRPYVSQCEYVASQAAIQSLSVLSSFSFLIQENVLPANPVSQVRQKSKFIRKHQSQEKIRRLSPLQWDYVIESAQSLANQNPVVHERTLFIMNALFAVSEGVGTGRDAPGNPNMGHFQMDQEGNWWFLTVGKGNKEREISVSDCGGAQPTVLSGLCLACQ